MKNKILLIINKRILLGLAMFILSLLSYAQSQYDYYDDDAVAGGADRALNGILIIIAIVFAIVVIAFIGNGIFKVYYWFNPEADSQKKKDEIQKEIKKEHDNLDNSQLDKKEVEGQFIQVINNNLDKQQTIEKDGYVLSSDGDILLEGNNSEECHIPYGVKVIRGSAFNNCTKIKNLYIPDSVEEIEENSFEYLNIESVHIPKSIKKMGDFLFFYCQNLKKVYIDDGLKLIGTGMFFGCTKIKIIKLPDTIEIIRFEAFGECSSLDKINLPSNVKFIGNGAFKRCNNLKFIEIPRNVVGLTYNLFSSCCNLSEVILNEGLTVISDNCFHGCSNLKRIRIPSTIQVVFSDAFSGCSNLLIEVPKGTEQYFRKLNLKGVLDIIEYDVEKSNISEDLKEKTDNYIRMWHDLFGIKKIEKVGDIVL